MSHPDRILQIGDIRVPYSFDRKSLKLPDKPNKGSGKYADKVGLVIPKQANVFLWKSAKGWGGNSGIAYFLKQNPKATQVVKGLYDNKIQTREYRDDAFLAGINNPHFNVEEPYLYPENLQELIKIAQKEWGWTIEPRIFELFAQASFGLLH